jgi:hypothetical protein
LLLSNWDILTWTKYFGILWNGTLSNKNKFKFWIIHFWLKGRKNFNRIFFFFNYRKWMKCSQEAFDPQTGTIFSPIPTHRPFQYKFWTIMYGHLNWIWQYSTENFKILQSCTESFGNKQNAIVINNIEQNISSNFVWFHLFHRWSISVLFLWQILNFH